MEAPPSYSPPKKKMSTCLIVVIICAVLGLLCCGGGGILGYLGFGKIKDIAACGQGFQSLQQSLFDYTDAHGGKLPKATTWMDDIRPYYVKRAAAHKEEAKIFGSVPTEGIYTCTRNGQVTAIVYNSDLSGKELKKIKDPEGTVLIFESNVAPALNVAQKYSPLPDATSPETFGKHAGWFLAHASGEVQLGKAPYNAGNSNGFRVETRSTPEPDSK